MKNYKFLFAFFAIIFIPSLLAQDEAGSNLNLSLYDGSNFSYAIDNNQPSEFIDEADLSGISSGKHYLKIIQETNRMKKNPDVLFSDYVEIPSGSSLFAVIDEYGKFYIYKKINHLDYHRHTDSKCNCDCEYCRNCIFKKKNPDETNNQDYDCKSKIINAKDFEDLKNSVSSKSFEQTKLEIIKQAVDWNYISSRQLKELLQLFSFEDSKVEAAKYAYDKVCDKKNFSTIYDVFSFESSITSVAEYVKSKK